MISKPHNLWPDEESKVNMIISTSMSHSFTLFCNFQIQTPPWLGKTTKDGERKWVERDKTGRKLKGTVFRGNRKSTLYLHCAPRFRSMNEMLVCVCSFMVWEMRYWKGGGLRMETSVWKRQRAISYPHLIESDIINIRKGGWRWWRSEGEKEECEKARRSFWSQGIWGVKKEKKMEEHELSCKIKIND